MIMGYLANAKEELQLYPAALQKGFAFLLESDFSKLPFGRQEIEGSQIYASIKEEYATKPLEQCRYEAHVQYVDIQYIVSGEEMNIAAPVDKVGECVENRIVKGGDAVFYKHAADQTKFILSEGMFAVYFPWDAHLTKGNVGKQSHHVRKIVVKVAMHLL